QDQWLAVMGTNPAEFTGRAVLPVDSVSWEDCHKFCERLSGIADCLVRLPSEAEWEYACRAGTISDYFFGDDPKSLDEYAWFETNSGEHSQPVGMKKPNPWGLFDVIGNLWEWCQDVWHSDYTDAPLVGS